MAVVRGEFRQADFRAGNGKFVSDINKRETDIFICQILVQGYGAQRTVSVV